MNLKMRDLKDSIIFCDFDGTVTIADSLGVLLEEFANSEWLDIEQVWRNGEIGSKECLTRQMDCIKNISSKQFDKFLESIKIDEYFNSFHDFIKNTGVDFYIVSDGFSLIIDKVLEKNNIFGVNIISNELTLENNRLIPSFPHENLECKVKNGNCKCQAIRNHAENKQINYIGDGLSDACAVKNADIVFAKDDLAKYCKDKNIDYILYKDFSQIFSVLSEREEYANC